MNKMEEAMADNNNRASHVVYDSGELGSVKIADDVIACIAGLAAMEVEGVDSMAGHITRDLLAMLRAKNISKGVKLDIDGEDISLDLTLNVKYGYSIPKISSAVQDKVKTTLENMTGLHVARVGINIAGVNTQAE